MSLIPVVIITLLVTFIGIPAWVKHHYKKQVEKFYTTPSNSSFLLKTEFIIEVKGIQSKDDTSTTMHSWSAFYKKVETEKYFYLYLNTILALVIPKMVFKSLKEKEEFENLLLAHFPLHAELNSLKQ